jgi:hypothetical protein
LFAVLLMKPWNTHVEGEFIRRLHESIRKIG